MRVHYFKDEEGCVWSVTDDEVLRDAQHYEEDSGETIEDPWQFFLDNIDESMVVFKLVSKPGLPTSPRYRKPSYLTTLDTYE